MRHKTCDIRKRLGFERHVFGPVYKVGLRRTVERDIESKRYTQIRYTKITRKAISKIFRVKMFFIQISYILSNIYGDILCIVIVTNVIITIVSNGDSTAIPFVWASTWSVRTYDLRRFVFSFCLRFRYSANAAFLPIWSNYGRFNIFHRLGVCRFTFLLILIFSY